MPRLAAPTCWPFTRANSAPNTSTGSGSSRRNLVFLTMKEFYSTGLDFPRFKATCGVVRRTGPRRHHWVSTLLAPSLLTHKITFFWAMCLIVAKYIARRNGVGVTKMTRVIARTLDEIAELGVLSGVPAEFRDSLPTNLADTSADARVNLLRELACHAEVLSKRLMAQGVAIPSEAVEQIYRFIYLAETLSVKPWGPYERESANTECASQ